MHFTTQNPCDASLNCNRCAIGSGIRGISHGQGWPSTARALRRAGMVFVVGLVFLFVACGPADFLNPLYVENHLASDPILPGVWEAKRDKGRMLLEFRPAKGGCYALTLIALPEDKGDPDAGEDGEPNHMGFDACLVQLGHRRFLDLQPAQIPVEAVTERFHLNPSPRSSSESLFRPDIFHTSDGLFITFAPVRPSDPYDTQPEYEVRLTPAHWIFKFWVDQTTLRLIYLDPPEDIATLRTKDLQRVVIQHADDPDFFSSGDSLEFERQNGGS